MQVELILEPGVSMGWEKFCKTKPPFSIAVDGFVHRGPREKISKNGRWINFNHHE